MSKKKYAREDIRDLQSKIKYVLQNKYFNLFMNSMEWEGLDDEVEETLIDPKQRIIKQITVEDFNTTSVLFEQLMGTGVTARKAYIKEHSKEATYNAE